MNESSTAALFMSKAMAIEGLKLDRNNVGRMNGVAFGCGGRGAADYLGVKGGRFIAVEVKGSGGRLSPAQVRYAAEVACAGGLFFVVTPSNIAEIISELEAL